MKLSMNISRLIASLALLSFLSGCTQITQRQNNAMGIGAGIGALLGAGAGGGIAAGTTKHNGPFGLNKAENAAIGVLAGALVGAAMG